ncbi:hypothetical protein WN943_025367 [Citrus x changshan-huyou]
MISRSSTIFANSSPFSWIHRIHPSRSTFSRWNLIPAARHRHCNLVVATARQLSPLLILHESDLPLLLVTESSPPLPPAPPTVVPGGDLAKGIKKGEFFEAREDLTTLGKDYEEVGAEFGDGEHGDQGDDLCLMENYDEEEVQEVEVDDGKKRLFEHVI